MEKWARLRYKPCLPMGADGRCVTGSKEHIEISRKIADEGIVLLKNDNNLLPLKKGASVAVFGKAQYDYVHSGGGSGYVFTPYIRNIYAGLKLKADNGQLYLYDGLIDFYKEEVEKQYKAGRLAGYTEEPELTEEQIDTARRFTDTAIITICRFSAEGYDRKGEKHDGDFYLSEAEEKMINAVSAKFDKIIVTINAGAQTDSEWYFANDKIGAVLYAWQGGTEGGLAVADVICGDVNPSGKLVDTFAKEFSDYPSADTFNESDRYVKYYEDVYVGYRYFETVKGAAERVNYPFGYGLSYTTFDLNVTETKQTGEKIAVKVNVTNTGKRAGKEVLQAYYSAPQGKLGKPARELAAFVKTDLLQPGESRIYTMEFDINSMASYDDLGKVRKSAYVLEAGTYTFHIGNSVRSTVKADFEYTLGKDVIVKQLTMQCPPARLEKRMLSDGSFEEMPSFAPNTAKIDVPQITAKAPEEEAMLIDVVNGKVSLDEFIAQLSDEQLIKLTRGTRELYHCSESGGIGSTYGVGGVERFGIPEVMSTDGPAGMRVRYTQETSPDKVFLKTTALPIATMIACTWNTELAYAAGETGAKEVKENNVGMWLTPAMNIHRNPLCGRNFEYFSEDPLIAGKMAAAEVSGIQAQHIAPAVKHFVANNKEVDRFESDSILSERALREIYLKGFEICVKEAEPWAIMSSYNIVNGKRASENYDTLTEILRNEWGYNGTVVSDWNNHALIENEIVCGNDVRMPENQGPMVDGKYLGDAPALEKLKNGELPRGAVQLCVKHVLELIMKLD